MTYMRYIDGAFITAGGDMKGNYAEGEKGGTYTKTEWPAEKIEFRINDSGIVGFDYISPICIEETVVDTSAMKPFEEVCDTFEKMIAVTNADEYSVVELDIDRVKLGYAIVSEQDSYDTGLIVPVWDFFGVKKTMSNGEMKASERYQPHLTINAIDNSIIDRELGY